MSAVLVNQEVLLGILGSVPLEPGWREHHDCCILAETREFSGESTLCGKRPSRVVARRCHCSSGVTISSLETRCCGVGVSSECWCRGVQQGLALHCVAGGAALKPCRLLIDISTSKEKMPMCAKCAAPQKGPFCIPGEYAVLWYSCLWEFVCAWGYLGQLFVLPWSRSPLRAGAEPQQSLIKCVMLEWAWQDIWWKCQAEEAGAMSSFGNHILECYW